MSLLYLVKCTPYAADRRFIAFLKQWMVLVQKITFQTGSITNIVISARLLVLKFITQQLQYPPSCAKILPTVNSLNLVECVNKRWLMVRPNANVMFPRCICDSDFFRR